MKKPTRHFLNAMNAKQLKIKRQRLRDEIDSLWIEKEHIDARLDALTNALLNTNVEIYAEAILREPVLGIKPIRLSLD